MRKGASRALPALVVAAVWAATVPAAALGAFPYKPQNGPNDWSGFRLPAGSNQTPNDLSDKRVWMYASTPAPNADPLVRTDKRELNGVRGAHLADAADVDQAWRTTTGRPDVTIAVLDSGIKWNDLGGMLDIRLKTRIAKGETPTPVADRATSTEPGQNCATYQQRDGFDPRDLNGDGVFNIVDYSCDTRVSASPAKGVGPTHNGAPLLDPQDVLIAFTNGDDADGNGYVDDIVGWDFLDDDNDPFDDVQYGHGTGEARDSAGEADNGGDLGTCPNCMEIHMRVGTSFIADVNRFALAVLYAADNDVLVVQEALGTLNKSKLGADAVKYAYDHGTVVIASAADEAAQHHNWPSSYPYSIVVNSVTHFKDSASLPGSTYLAFNGCTNFSSRITLAIPSVSCSSDATGRGAGMAGIIYSAALNAIEADKLDPHPTCKQTDGDACPISANEVRQLMASGTVSGTLVSDDVNFSQDPITGASTELSCKPIAVVGCTDPFLSAPNTRVSTSGGRSYPARKGHDQFYGYGRVNMNKGVDAIVPDGVKPSRIPPEAELTSPDWYEMIDPSGSISVKGHAYARGAAFSCKVLAAPGSYPSDSTDFTEIPSPVCNGETRTERVDGEIASLSTADLMALFPPNAGDHTGREPGIGEQPHSARPNTEPYGFTLKIVATSKTADDVTLTGQDRRQAYLHRDKDMLHGFPKHLPGDGEASPVLADLDGDNRNELILANSDGVLHAFRRDGSEAAGFPVYTDVLPLHPESPAFKSGKVGEAHGAVLATPAVGDIDHDGTLEIVVADLESKVYVFGHDGKREDEWRTRIEYSGKPLAPFENVRKGKLHRVQPGFIGSPVLADIDGNDGGKLEVVAAAMDRHTYAWNHDGTDVPGWPVLVVDPAKVAAVDPTTHMVTFKPDAEADFQQGALISTPAVGNLDADPLPEVVVGSNESYAETINAGGLDQALYAPLGAALSPANGRLFALEPNGDLMPGWPFKVGILQAEILPLVGEGVTGAPVIGNVTCNGEPASPRVGVIPAAGIPYVINPDGTSCYGRMNGLDIALPTTGGAGTDPVFLAAFGHPLFGKTAAGDVFVAPAAGVMRAADVVLPEYQGGKDYLVAWQTDTGKIAPGWPAEMNDLQFLTGPSVAELNAATPGEEFVAGSAHHDLQGFTGAGTDMSADWPKLTGDWTVANPVMGSFGEIETDAATKRTVIAATRNGRVTAYTTSAPACTAASWPQFHHDRHNTGSTTTDAVAPGRPSDASFEDGELKFTAPGDDLLCGSADEYEVRTSADPMTEANFAAGEALGVGSAAPKAPGAQESLVFTSGTALRYLAVRAADDAGNVGRLAVIDRGPPPGTGGGGGDDDEEGPQPAGSTGGTTGGPAGGQAPPPGTTNNNAPPAGGQSGLRVTEAQVTGAILQGLGVKCVRRTGRLSRGMRISTARRRGEQLRRVSSGIYMRKKGTKLVISVRRGRINSMAMVPRTLQRNRSALRIVMRHCAG